MVSIFGAPTPRFFIVTNNSRRFFDELPIPNGSHIAPELNAQSHYASLRIGTKDAHPQYPQWLADDKHPALTPISAKNMNLHWPRHAVPGTTGFELIQGLPHPSEYNYFVWKGIEPDMHPYGNCFHDLAETLSTGLIEFLRAKKIRCVIIGGLATDHCVKTTALQLQKNGFQVICNLSACRGLQTDTTQNAIDTMKKAGIILIKHTNELVRFIKES